MSNLELMTRADGSPQVLIHFGMNGHVACNTYHPGPRFKTSDLMAVNCLLCKESSPYANELLAQQAPIAPLPPPSTPDVPPPIIVTPAVVPTQTPIQSSMVQPAVDYDELLRVVNAGDNSNGKIKNLERRKWLWDHKGARGPEHGHDLHDSLPYPFEPAIQNMFDGKDVMEIGPGNGRQYERLRERVKSYSVCDISAKALDDPVFYDAAESFVLDSWDQSLGRLFDVIHFWYVLHHVRLDEMRAFFAFVSRHLRDNGLVAFNCPQRENVQGDMWGDGEGTTYSDPVIIKEAAVGLEMLMALPVGRKSTGFVFLMRKVLAELT